jgi:REP-associated tyrosine transposase
LVWVSFFWKHWAVAADKEVMKNALSNRGSRRMPGYNYAAAGRYFVTICTENRIPCFGDIVGGRMMHNQAGAAICQVWEKAASFFDGATIDFYAVMPDHTHAGIVLAGFNTATVGRSSLSDVVRRFKTWTTNQYSRGVADHNWQPFPGRLWQRNFHDRIIRTDEEWDRKRQYTLTNPTRHRL